MELISNSVKDTQKIARDFASTLLQKAVSAPGAVVVALSGDLGAGKTTFVQGMARGMGIDPKDYVNSPTFTLIQEYQSSDSKQPLPFIHADLYRMQNTAEWRSLGLEDYWERKSVIVIEWPDRLGENFKSFDYRVHLEVTGTARKISIYES